MSDSIHIDTIQLKEIIIENKIKRIENKFDRKVVSISETQKAAARSVFDILRTLPGVVVDEDGNIRYKGAEASIQVDEQDAKQILGKVEMIPVERIDKIELIDAAMRTGGDGRGGIINIKLKPVRNDGISGMISARLNTAYFKEINNSREFGNLNYKTNKFTFFANSTLETTRQNTQTDSKNDFSLLDLPNIQTITDNDFWKRTAISNYIGGFYTPSANTKIYLSLSYLIPNSHTEAKSDFLETNSKNKTKITEFDSENQSKENQLWTGAYLSYWHKMDTLDTYIKLSASSNIFNVLYNENSLYNYSILNSESMDSIYKYKNIRDIYTKNFYFNAFYNQSVSEKTRWNLSYNLALDRTDPLVYHQYIFEQLNLPLEQSTENLNQRHNFSFRIGTKWKKWKWDAGLNLLGELNKGKYLRYQLNGNDTVLNLNKKYIRLLPSTTIAYLPNEATEIKLSLSKTAEFPFFLQLSDYIDKNNIYQWQSGNSTLKPVDFYSSYLSYNYQVNQWSVSTEFFYNHTNNNIENLTIPVSSLIFLSKPENIAKSSDVGIDMSVWYQVAKNLDFTLASSIYHTYFDISSLMLTAESQDLTLPELTRKQYGFNIKYSMEYSLKDIYTTFYANYHSKETIFNGYKKSYISSALNISKKFIKNKLRISLSINNIFSNFIKRGSYSDEFGVINNTLYNGTPYGYNYSISFQYDFNKGDRGTKDLR